MVDAAKITLSEEERQLVTNTGWILTKHAVVAKVYRLFGMLATGYVKTLAQVRGPEQLLSPKISKGENYLLLPYVVLDYPRQYGKQEIMAIRTMFWWGNFFSVTLHLSGKYQQAAMQNIIAHVDHLRANNYFICTGDEEWQHHFGKENYTAIKEKSNEELIALAEQKLFIKLAVKFELRQWDDMPRLLQHAFEDMLRLLPV